MMLPLASIYQHERNVGLVPGCSLENAPAKPGAGVERVDSAGALADRATLSLSQTTVEYGKLEPFPRGLAEGDWPEPFWSRPAIPRKRSRGGTTAAPR